MSHIFTHKTYYLRDFFFPKSGDVSLELDSIVQWTSHEHLVKRKQKYNIIEVLRLNKAKRCFGPVAWVQNHQRHK